MYILKRLYEGKSAEQLSYEFRNFDKFWTPPHQNQNPPITDDFLNFAYQLDDYKR